MTCRKLITLSEDEIDDQACELYARGQLSELAEFSLRYPVDPHWSNSGAMLAQKLSSMDVPEALFRRYVDLVYQNCELTVIDNHFSLSETTLVVDVRVSRKHLTEGGRIAEAITDVHVGIMDGLTVEERRLLCSVQVVFNVDEYSDGDEDEDEDDEDDTNCDHDTSPCLCDDCVREREEVEGPDTSEMAKSYKLLH